ncbi:hypothetical protein JHK85_020500 [Glycine max]|nr:hypothetical protein JHK85_020500 [Glycine max]KAG5024156.1 hypothetical protein JHK86_020070 [Glycine max]
MGLFKSKGVVYRPVKDVNLGSDSTEFYLQANVKAPRMTGILVKIFTWFLESPILGSLLFYILKGNNLIHKLITNAELEESPLFVPSHHFEGSLFSSRFFPSDHKEQEVKCLDSALTPQEQVQLAIECLPTSSEKAHNETNPSFSRWTIMDYSRAYSSGDITPLMVAERFIAAINESSKPPLRMGFFINYNAEDILRQANESTLRYQKGTPISVLDGVPVAIKDEMDCLPYPTTGGTKWLHKERLCTDDACCVKRLRLCGAILVGKTNMHELGVGTSGINPHYGVCMFIYFRRAARNPYDINKISGGSSSGSAAVVSAGLCPVALGVDGGGSVRMPASLCGVVGLKPTFGRVPHSGVLPLNWTVGMVGILAGTVEDALITYAAIGGEISSHQSSNMLIMLLPCHEKASGSLWLEEFGWDARVALNIYGAFSGKEYIKAQKLRNRQLQFHMKIFAEADVIVSPTTGVTAYSIQDDALKTGELDYVNGAALVRYSISGNFLGLPAVTVPVGYDKLGLPIGLQFIGRPWAEATLIHLAFAMQVMHMMASFDHIIQKQ